MSPYMIYMERSPQHPQLTNKHRRIALLGTAGVFILAKQTDFCWSIVVVGKHVKHRLRANWNGLPSTRPFRWCRRVSPQKKNIMVTSASEVAFFLSHSGHSSDQNSVLCWPRSFETLPRWQRQWPCSWTSWTHWEVGHPGYQLDPVSKWVNHLSTSGSSSPSYRHPLVASFVISHDDSLSCKKKRMAYVRSHVGHVPTLPFEHIKSNAINPISIPSNPATN